MTWLITSAVTNALVVIPLAGIAWLLARYSKRPALAHLVWAAVLVKLLTPPIITIPVPWQIDPDKLLAQWQPRPVPAVVESTPAAPAVEVKPVRRSSDQGAVVRKPSASHKKVTPPPSKPQVVETMSLWSPLGLLRMIGAAWVLGALGFAGRSLYLAWRFNRSLGKARSEEFLNIRMGRIAQANGFTNWPEVVLLDGVFSPMLWGMGRRARLVFPAELAARLDRAASDTLLLHELAHYSRGDHWVRILELAAQTLFWWHPVVWFAHKAIEAAEEECCDAWVIERQSTPRRTYAEALLATIDFLNEQSPALPPIASGLGQISLLRHRLTQIMRNEPTPGLSPQLRIAVAVCAALIAPLGPAVFASSRPMRDAKPAKTASLPEADKVDDHNPGIVTLPAKATPERPHRFVPPSDLLKGMSQTPWAPPSLWATALSADGKYKLEAKSVGGATRITLYNLSDGFRIDLSSDGITCVSFSADGRFVTGHQDGNVRVWNSSTGGIELNLKGSDAPITSVAFGSQPQLVAAGNTAGQVLVWDVAPSDDRTRYTRFELTRQSAAISCVRWSVAGDRLAITLAAWDENDAELLIWYPGDDTEQHRLPLSRPAGALSWLTEDSVLVADWDGMASVWELTTGEAVSRQQLDKNSLSAAAWSPDCPLLPPRRAQEMLLEAP